MHSAPGNSSADTAREITTIISLADVAHVTEPKNPHQENDRDRGLDGLNPGSLAASKLNPLVL